MDGDQMADVNLPYLCKKRTQRGQRVYYYFRRDGLYVRLPDPSSPRFALEYQRLLNTEEAPAIMKGTLAALVREYRASPEYKALAISTRRNRDIYADRLLEKHAKKKVSALDTPSVYRIRDELQDRPGVADNTVATLSALMKFAQRRGWRSDNPCAGVERISKGEHAPWPQHVMDEILEMASPMLRLAVQTHYFTGQRISDVCAMTWHAIHDNTITVVQQKTGKELEIPLHKDFRSALREVPRESIYLLYNRHKKPFTPDALRDRLRRITNYKFHGLRKNAVNALLEADCTTWQVAAITGQSQQVVEYYARRVNQRKLALKAIRKWEVGNIREKSGKH